MIIILTIEQTRKKIINYESRDRPRLNMLYEYYIGKHTILNQSKPPGKPNNRIVVNFCKNITNTTVGYFMGKPLTYKCNDTQLLDEINEVVKYNDDQHVNAKLAKDLSIMGRACEVLWFDGERIRYNAVNPMNVIVVYDSTMERNVTDAIRWVDEFDDDGKRTRYIYVYDAEQVITYKFDGTLQELERQRHFFKQVPVNMYYNNDDERGDFEDIIPQNDAYNTMQSESVNDFQKYADAILVLKNMRMPEKTDENGYRDKDVLEIFNDGDASYLVKQVNDAYVENIKNRLKEDIYTMSNTVNMSDDQFSQAASGRALQQKWMNFENRVSITESFFKKGLMRRLELICEHLNLKKTVGYNYTDISIQFTRNIPVDEPELTTETVQLDGIVSRETLLSRLPFIDDVQEELKRIEKERDTYQANNFGHEIIEEEVVEDE